MKAKRIKNKDFLPFDVNRNGSFIPLKVLLTKDMYGPNLPNFRLCLVHIQFPYFTGDLNV